MRPLAVAAMATARATMTALTAMTAMTAMATWTAAMMVMMMATRSWTAWTATWAATGLFRLFLWCCCFFCTRDWTPTTYITIRKKKLLAPSFHDSKLNRKP